MELLGFEPVEAALYLSSLGGRNANILDKYLFVRRSSANHSCCKALQSDHPISLLFYICNTNKVSEERKSEVRHITKS